MSGLVLVETTYGKRHKYEILRESGTLGLSFYVRKDGEPFKGPYSSLSVAVEAARKAG